VTEPPTKRSFRSKTSSSAALVFLAALLVYIWTLAPTVTLVDSGELIVAARFLGVAHPPGFPLYMMLAHLASLIPIGNIAVRVNFVSAFFAALACAMLAVVVTELIVTASYVVELQRRSRQAARKRRKTSPHSLASAADGDSISSWVITIAPAICAGLLLAFSRTLWSYATIAEVYTLNAFLILTTFFLMLRWRRRILEDARSASTIASSRGSKAAIVDYDSLLYAAAIVFGLALGVHHVTVALILPALAVLVYKTQGFGFFASKRLFYAAVLSFVALLAVYSYLPLAAANSPILNWGDPRSVRAIWAHVTGKQYQLFLSFSPSIMREQFLQFGRFLLVEFGTPWFPIAFVAMIAGFIAAFKRDRSTFLFLLFVILADLAYALNYNIGEDKDAYYLPTFIALTVFAGIGLHLFLQLALAKRSFIVSRLLIVGGAILVPALALAGNWPFNNRRHYFIAHDYVENIQSTIEPNSLLLTLDWQVASPMLYTREIEQRRRDIRAVDVNLLRRSWYFEYLRRAYPDLIERSRDKIDVYVADLKEWESDPEAYQKSAALTRKISTAFREMLQSIVTKEMVFAPVYVTAEVILFTDPREDELAGLLKANFQAVPRGLVFQLTRDTDFHDPGEPRLQTRGLVDGAIRFAEDDAVKVKVLPVYKAMMQSRGQYLATFNQQERAAAAFKEARRFDPDRTPAPKN
jgi:hypothetical protein